MLIAHTIKIIYQIHILIHNSTVFFCCYLSDFLFGTQHTKSHCLMEEKERVPSLEWWIKKKKKLYTFFCATSAILTCLLSILFVTQEPILPVLSLFAIFAIISIYLLLSKESFIYTLGENVVYVSMTTSTNVLSFKQVNNNNNNDSTATT